MIRVWLLLGLALAAPAEELRPVDESAKDASFAAFRTQLLGALERRDVKFVNGILAANIRNSFGGDGGVAEFRKVWKLDRPAESKLWRELGEILRLGGTWENGEFVAPYVFSRFPHRRDAFTWVAVVKPGALLRDKPGGVGKPMGFAVVETMPGEARPGWSRVRMEDGVTGWVRVDEVRSSIGWRAFFGKVDGRWRLMALLSGD